MTSIAASVARPAVVLFAALTLATGVLYPLAVTGIAKLAFPSQAAGSLVERKGVTIGSALIGQGFADPKHFWGRPSATAKPYDAANSSGSNLGPTNPALIDAVKQRVAALRAADPGNVSPVPVDLVTTSASGIDPHISVAAAEFQAARVAKARGIPVTQVQASIERNTQDRQFGFLGEPRVNVLALNLALDAAAAP